jgi:hypothetical protein
VYCVTHLEDLTIQLLESVLACEMRGTWKACVHVYCVTHLEDLTIQLLECIDGVRRHHKQHVRDAL